jgi:cytochrome P450
VPTSAGMTVEETVHRRRRGAMNPFFSRASIESQTPTIREKAARMCTRLEELQGTGAVLDLESIYLALTTDVLTQCSYGYSYNYLGTWRILKDSSANCYQIIQILP